MERLHVLGAPVAVLDAVSVRPDDRRHVAAPLGHIRHHPHIIEGRWPVDAAVRAYIGQVVGIPERAVQHPAIVQQVRVDRAAHFMRGYIHHIAAVWLCREQAWVDLDLRRNPIQPRPPVPITSRRKHDPAIRKPYGTGLVLTGEVRPCSRRAGQEVIDINLCLYVGLSQHLRGDFLVLRPGRLEVIGAVDRKGDLCPIQ